LLSYWSDDHNEIQRGKEGMKRNSIIQTLGPQRITLHLLEDSIAEDEHNYFHGIQGGAWFGSVRTASEVGIRGYEGAFQVKQYSALFPKDLNSTCSV
jgi:hypothetical protein